MKTKRKSGYYWVKIHESYEWDILKYNGETKRWEYDLYEWQDSELYKIDERRIERMRDD